MPAPTRTTSTVVVEGTFDGSARTNGRRDNQVGMDFTAVKQVLAAFERNGVRYAVFGATALNLHGLARFTEDLDVFVAPDRENIDRLKSALFSVFADPEIEGITADDLMGDYPAVKYIPPTGAFYLDILTRLGEAFAYETLETERVAFDDLQVTVVTPRTLYRMKKDTVRLQDKADAQVLRERFSLREDE